MKKADLGIIFFDGDYDDIVIETLENLEEIELDGERCEDESFYQINPVDKIFSVSKVLNILNDTLWEDNYQYTFFAHDSNYFISNDDAILLLVDESSLDSIKFNSVDEAKQYLINEYDIEDEELENLSIPKDFVHFITQLDDIKIFLYKED